LKCRSRFNKLIQKCDWRDELKHTYTADRDESKVIQGDTDIKDEGSVFAVLNSPPMANAALANAVPPIVPESVPLNVKSIIVADEHGAKSMSRANSKGARISLVPSMACG
jgi:hypothetical protein